MRFQYQRPNWTGSGTCGEVVADNYVAAAQKIVREAHTPAEWKIFKKWHELRELPGEFEGWRCVQNFYKGALSETIRVKEIK